MAFIRQHQRGIDTLLTVQKEKNRKMAFLGLYGFSSPCIILLVLQAALVSPAFSFLPPVFSPWRTVTLNSVAVPVSELEKDLTPAERGVTSVVRNCGPSVAFVTSVWQTSSSRADQQRKGGDENSLPPGMSLGSGSGFQVSPGYLCTNFHVIERAYTTQQSSESATQLLEQVVGNVTRFLSIDDAMANQTCPLEEGFSQNVPQVFVRINSSTKFEKASIVGVEPDLDLAVLKIDSFATTLSSETLQETVPFGSSSNLLVGQSVIAIGNPFGLDKTVTTGVVSAVNRELRAGTAMTPSRRPIRGCVQTDCSINPGNSGGPLLNLKGEVIGINTAIITTSGSNAGIGFAVPSDKLSPVVNRIIRQDRIENGERPNKGWLGVGVIRTAGTNSTISDKNWVSLVEPGSPAEEAGIRATKILDNGVTQWGDAIVAVGGNEVANFEELQMELDERVIGENIALTLESYDGERRVVYVTLQSRPE